MGQFLKAKKAKTISGADPRHLFKDPLHKVLCHCMEQGVPLVLDCDEMAEGHPNLIEAVNGVKDGLYDDLFGGKLKEEGFLGQLKGDDAAKSKNADNFCIFMLTKVDVIPMWCPEDAYVAITVQ